MDGEAPTANPVTNKAVIAIAVVLLVAAGFYVFYSSGFGAPSGPDFVIEDEQFNFAPGQVKTNLRELSLNEANWLDVSQAYLLGRVEQAPTVNSETGEYEMVVSFERKSGRSVSATITLGNGPDIIPTHFADGGLIGRVKSWDPLTVADVAPSIAVGEPIFIELYVDQIEDTLLTDVRCSALCRETLLNARENFQRNSDLIGTIIGRFDNTRGLSAGAVSELIIYSAD